MAHAAEAASWTVDLRLEENLDTREVIRRARASLRGRDLTARASAYYLADLKDRKAWTEIGSPNAEHFAEHAIGESLSNFETYARVGRALRKRRYIDGLFEAGRLNWTKVRAIIPKTTRKTEKPWADFAAAHTIEEVEDEARHRKRGELPGGLRGIQLKDKKIRLLLNLPVLVFQLLQRAKAKASAESGTRVGVLGVLVHLLQLYLRSEADGSLPGWKPVQTEHYVLHAMAGEGGVGWAIDAKGRPFPFNLSELRGHALKVQVAQETEVAAEAASEPEGPPPIPETSIGDTRAVDPENNGPYVPREERDAPASKGLRDEVLLGAGRRCAICGSRFLVQVHHRKWRRYGGPTALSNLLPLCIDCHSLVHARLMVIQGQVGALRVLGSDGREIRLPTAEPVAFCRVKKGARMDGSTPAVETVPEVEATDARGFEGERVQARLADLVGQCAARARVAVVIEAARARGEQPGHMLFSGPPGLGKTALAEAVAGELGGAIVRAPAPQVQTVADMARVLTSVKTGGVLFMDELHALGDRCAEVLYEALDRGVVSDPEGGMVRLPPFTFVGASSEEDQVPRALRSRLIRERLTHYSPEHMSELLSRAATGMGLELGAEAAGRLAAVSRGTPRDGLRILRAVRDDATLARVTAIDAALVERTLGRLEIDHQGLDALMREYLAVLARAKRALAVCTIAAELGTSEVELQETVEPWLKRLGKIRVTSRGRLLA